MATKKKEMRIESKKRKVKAFFEIAMLNDSDRKKPKIGDNESEGNNNNNKGDKADSGVDGEWSTADPTNLHDDELIKMRLTLRLRQKAAMESPKLYLTLDTVGRETSSGDLHPTLFVRDIQSLLLFAFCGNTTGHIPRFCRLLRWTKLSHVVVLGLCNVSYDDYEEHLDSFTNLQDIFDMSLKLVNPAQYSGTVLEELFKVPQSQLENFRPKAKSTAGKVKQKTADSKPKVCVLTTANSEALTKEGESGTPVDWVNLISESHKDAFPRTNLLLRPEQMIDEGYPVPLVDKPEYCTDYVYSQDCFTEVTDSSPLFAIDCEMCLTIEKKSELTRVSIVDEDGNTVYDTLVKPDNKIINYLTRFSGITPKMMQKCNVRLRDVQAKIRQLLSPDAILCGQSLNGDLHVLKMFHPYVIDTSVIYNLTGARKMKTGLKRLAQQFLGRAIQDNEGGHSSVEDATATMQLILLKLRNSIQFGDVTMGHLVYEKEIQEELNDKQSSHTQKCEKCQAIACTCVEDTIKCEEIKEECVSCDSSSVDYSNTCEPEDISDKDGLCNKNMTRDSCLPCEQHSSNEVDKDCEKRATFFRHYGQGPCRSFFDYLDEGQRPACFIDQEDVIEKNGDSLTASSIKCPIDNDKEGVRTVKQMLINHKFTWLGLHGAHRQSGEENVKKCLKNLDKRIKKVDSILPDKTLSVVIMTGRTSGGSFKEARCFLKIKDTTSNK